MSGGKDPGVAQLGLRHGMVVQELGWDSDVDEELRNAIMDAIDADMLEEASDAVDVVVLWWRVDDGDVVDGLIDALRDLSREGVVWLMTPKHGRPGHIPQADLTEGALTAGLALTSTATVSKDWAANKIVRPKGGRK